MWRRRSPSVTMPTSRAVGVDHADHAEALAAHLEQRLGHRRVGAGSAASRRRECIRSPTVRQPRAEPPARMQAAEILGREGAVLHQRHRQRVAERQRHRRRGGRREADRAGLGRRRQQDRDVGLADQRRVPPGRPRRSAGSRTGGYRRSGRRAPASRRSSTGAAPRRSAVIMPRSPWLASAGWTNSAGVPVEASVAAILRATWPDLPMPETITRPRACSISATAAAKAPSSVAASAPSAARLDADHPAAGGDAARSGRADGGRASSGLGSG